MTFGLRLSAGVAVLGASLVAACSLADAGGGDPKSNAGSGNVAGSSSGGSSAGTSNASSGGGGVPGGGGSPALGGSAGSSAGGSPAGGGAAGSSAGGSAAGGSAGGGGGVLCPADATFCSGFEDTALPTGAVYKFNAAPGDWSRDFAVDTTLFHSGKSSLRVKSASDDTGASGAYQMLAVPAPMATFWVRLYIQQTEFDIGLNDLGKPGEHNTFAGASASDDPNSAGTIEFAEDIGVAFNTSDDVRAPVGYGRVNGNLMPFTLLKGMWHCIEINYDSAKREQKLYINSALQIDATDYPKTVADPVKIFKFGFNKFHGPPRKVWFDDVAVGPTRAGCL
jgi:hypothetical protein